MSLHRMAILTASPSGGPAPAPHWPQRKTFRELIRLGRELDMRVFVVSPTDFDWRRRQARGYTLERRGGRDVWVRRRFPFPDAVYNRVSTRSAERSPQVQRCLRRLEALLGPRLFNPFYLNKATVSRIVASQPDLVRYLPPTRALKRWRDVERMLAEHRRIYLKPTQGSLGNYTVEITAGRADNGGHRLYRYRYNLRRGRTRTGHAYSLDGLRRALHPLLSGRSYVIQKAIRLARWQGRPFDIRTLVQKDETGQWVCTGAAARVAGPGQITTHVPRGGQRAPLRTVLGSWDPVVAEEVQNTLRRVSVRIAEVLERALGRNFAELSMDIGVDEDGHLWLFEANSKPLRFDEPDIRNAAQRRLLTYARALCRGSVRPVLDSIPQKWVNPFASREVRAPEAS